MNRIVIKNARLLDPSRGLDETGDLILENGKVAAAGKGSAQGLLSGGDTQVLDATGLAAAPGLVDMHVHLRDPGQTQKEDILSGCMAAAAGGVTSLLCMPNTSPAVDTAETVRYILEKAEKAAARVYVAAAITRGLGGEILTDAAALREAGAIALSDDGRPVVNTEHMARTLCAASALGMRVVSHCEDLFLSRGGLMHEGGVSRQLGVKGVPAAAEDCGTAREIALAEAYHVPVHICHVSTRTSVSMIRDAKHRGTPVTAETGPHYFAFTDKELLRRDADYRMSPPLREEEDRIAILEGLRDGTLDAIATDHAPHTAEEKAVFETAPNGVIGMETSLAAGITYLTGTGIFTLSELIRHMSTEPARILGIPAGTLAPGAPADVILFDPEERWTVSPERLHGKSRNAVFKGRTLKGRVKLTICRGEIVFGD